MSGVAVVDRIAVVVPACDEAEHLPACLAALTVAAGRAVDRGVEVDVLVVLDSCTDGSAAVVGRHPGVEMIAVGHRCVGSSRAAGVAAVLAGTVDSTRTWLAGTDADSQVPPDWLTHLIDCAEQGAHVVLGTVVPAGTELAGDAVHRWTGRHASVEGHPHVHGANFAVRADAYLDAGGWAELASSEDLDLVGRLSDLPGIVIRRSAATPVRTSDRLVGRAPDGFAAYLADLQGESEAVARSG